VLLSIVQTLILT